ncbi:MAG: hypothetical protein LUH45_00135, partial [Clostridiales bacterium]|nr:hypothetical protein [Clostridiales bacterium]
KQILFRFFTVYLTGGTSGYQVADVPYGGFPANVKGSREKMEACFASALAQTEELLRRVDFDQYNEILFLSKSIGTAIACAYGQRHGLRTRNVYFTPVAETFLFQEQPGIVFHGTGDSWADTAVIQAECEKRDLPLYLVPNADHSLETGDVLNDLSTLRSVMETVERYITEQEDLK